MIPLMKVHIPSKEELIPALQDTLYSGMLTEGDKVKDFELALQSKFKFPVRPLTTNSGTAALQLAYRCADIKNKIVLTTPMTCTATNMPILAEGGKIVWCDIDSSTGNISIEDVERKINFYGVSEIAAISAVDFAGYPANWPALVEISKRTGIALIEDAAQSLGAKINGKYVGEFTADKFFTAFSFQAIKHLTTADGGALVASYNWDRAKKLKWYGINREAVKEATRWHYDIPEWGYKSHMNNVNATIGLTQLPHIDNIINIHINNGKFFNKELQGISGLSILNLIDGIDPSYWIYMIKVDKREEFAKAMLSKGIGVNVAHIRNDTYSCFLNDSNVLNPHEERSSLKDFNDQYIALPCGWWVTEKDREHIVKSIKEGW